MTTTFDPAKTSALVTLSGGNLTATKNVGAANYASALSTSGHGGTKVYAEAKANAAGIDGGIGIATARPADGDFVGGNASSLGVYSDGVIYLNGASAGTVTPVPAVGDWIGVAIDRTAQTLNIRNVTKGGSFSAGASISTLVGPLYLGISSYDGGALTANFDGTFAGTPPTGHARWDGTPLSPVFTTLTAVKGTLTQTRNDAVLKRTYVMPAVKGTLALTGVATALNRAVPLTATTRAFALTGNTANLVKAGALQLAAQAGAFVLTASSATLARSYVATAVQGTLTLAGSTANLIVAIARRLVADAGTLLLTGNPVNLVHVAIGGYTLNAAAGAIMLSGKVAILRVARVPAAYEPVSFASLQNRKVIRGILANRDW